MKVIKVRNVHEALPEGLYQLHIGGQWRESRAGRVAVYPGPVTTQYEEPAERVVFHPLRDANPFFHLFESLWMLDGRNDLEFCKQFVSTFGQFSDDGVTLPGAYGFRWRSHFNHDQLQWAIQRLSDNPEDRRVIVGMYDPEFDHNNADNGGLDIPCNIAMHFQINPSGQLDMTVFNRSNDIVWGAYGANAVHMSFLQEYMAGMIGVSVGSYWQVSDNYHAYEEIFKKMLPLTDYVKDPFRPLETCPYRTREVTVEPLVTHASNFDQDLKLFLEDPASNGMQNQFFHTVCKPMWMAHKHFKAKRGSEKYKGSLEILQQMPETNDWRKAATEWIQRREAKYRKAADDGPDYEA
jgi:hypothetical protein